MLLKNAVFMAPERIFCTSKFFSQQEGIWGPVVVGVKVSKKLGTLHVISFLASRRILSRSFRVYPIHSGLRTQHRAPHTSLGESISGSVTNLCPNWPLFELITYNAFTVCSPGSHTQHFEVKKGRFSPFSSPCEILRSSEKPMCVSAETPSAPPATLPTAHESPFCSPFLNQQDGVTGETQELVAVHSEGDRGLSQCGDLRPLKSFVA